MSDEESHEESEEIVFKEDAPAVTASPQMVTKGELDEIIEVVRTLRSSRGHLMNKVNHLFYYVPGSHRNNKIDVANHGNVASIFWTPFSKWPPSKLVKLYFRL